MTDTHPCLHRTHWSTEWGHPRARAVDDVTADFAAVLAELRLHCRGASQLSGLDEWSRAVELMILTAPAAGIS